MLEPVREGYARDVALRWIRVHDLKDFAYFDHSVHLFGRAVGCETCHAGSDRMPLIRQVATAHHAMVPFDCHAIPRPPCARAKRCSRWGGGRRAGPPHPGTGPDTRPTAIEGRNLDPCYVCHR